MADISETCEVPLITNSNGDPVIETYILNTTLGKVVAQKQCFRRGMPTTKLLRAEASQGLTTD